MKEKFDVGALLRKTQEELQGFVLDLAKISPMNDRQYDQFVKAIKKHFRSQIDVINDTIRAVIAEGLMEIAVSERPPYTKDQSLNSTGDVIINDN